MRVPRPKILSRFNFSASQTFKIYLSQAAQFDTAVSTSIGTTGYFVSGDGQSDDLLFGLCGAMTTLIQAAHADFSAAFMAAEIDTDTGKITLKFHGLSGATQQDVRIAWTEGGSELADVLGFDSSADDDLTGADSPVATADWHHAFGWYSTDDGQLESLSVVPMPLVQAMQRRALAGQVVTRDLGTVYDAELALQFIENELMFSDGKAYRDAPVYPYARNKPLECWFYQALQGIEFRVYRDGYIDTARSVDRGTATGGAATTLTDTGKGWAIDPQEHDGKILYVPDYVTDGTQIGQTWKISSHTATVLTVPDKAHGVATNHGGSVYHIFDHRYDTYVLDVENFRKLDPPQTARGIDKYNLRIPLMKYVA